MSYTKTVIRILAAGTAFDGQFLKAGQCQDDVIGFTSTQGEGTLFNVPNTVYGFVAGFEAPMASSDAPIGDRTAYIDLLSHSQPVLLAEPDFLQDEPFTGALGCNTFAKDGGSKNRLECNTPSNAPFQYGSGWAICQQIEYARNALWIYDTQFYGDAPPPNCTAIDLKVIAAPDDA